MTDGLSPCLVLRSELILLTTAIRFIAYICGVSLLALVVDYNK